MILLTYTLLQLQEALQESSPEAARNRITLLERAHGFPPRLPGHTARWSRPAIDEWFLTWGAAPTAAAAAITPVIELRSMLEKVHA